MPLTNFPGGISSFGIPILGGGGVPATVGDVYFVNYGTGQDGNSGEDPTAALKTLSAAYSKMRDGYDDLCVLVGSSTHVLSEMLDVSKSRVHFVGLDTVCRRYGQNAKVSLGVTTAATDIATIQNTGTRNSFINMKVINSNTVTEGIYAFADGGEYTRMEFCELYKDTDLDQTGAAELLCNADSAWYSNLTIGSLVNAISGSILRPCVKLDRETITGKVARDVTFEECLFWRKAGDTANTYISAPGATDIERMLWVKNCTFVNAKLAGAVPAQCVKTASQTQGQALLENCNSINNTKLSTSTGVLITGPVPTYGTTGIAVQA